MQTRKVFTAYDAIYTTEILRFSINIECAIIESGMFDDDESLTLFHGTTRKHVPSIMANGLEPQLGDFTKHFYDIDDEDDDVEPLSELVFAADLAGLQRCVSAIGFQIMAETGNRDYSAEGMRTYGALCIFEVGKNDLTSRGRPGRHASPSRRARRLLFVLSRAGRQGDELVAFLNSNGVRLD